MLKKKDFIIIGTIILIIGSGFIFNQVYFHQNASLVQITVNNQKYQTVSLKQDQTIKINNTNTIVIHDETVYMETATCPDKLCVHQGKISKNGEQIICLPNQVVVAIISNKTNDVDASTN